MISAIKVRSITANESANLLRQNFYSFLLDDLKFSDPIEKRFVIRSQPKFTSKINYNSSNSHKLNRGEATTTKILQFRPRILEFHFAPLFCSASRIDKQISTLSDVIGRVEFQPSICVALFALTISNGSDFDGEIVSNSAIHTRTTRAHSSAETRNCERQSKWNRAGNVESSRISLDLIKIRSLCLLFLFSYQF